MNHNTGVSIVFDKYPYLFYFFWGGGYLFLELNQIHSWEFHSDHEMLNGCTKLPSVNKKYVNVSSKEITYIVRFKVLDR